MKPEAQYQALIEQVYTADPQALIELANRMNEEENEEVVDFLIDAFDTACLLYAMGGTSSPSTEHDDWQHFKLIVKYYDQYNDHQETLIHNEAELIQTKFEIGVLKNLQQKNNVGIDADYIAHSLELFNRRIEIIENSNSEEQQQLKFCEIWLDEAKKQLVHPRFSSLPKALMEDLIEAVSFRLSEKEHCDDCPTCVGDADELDDSEG